MPSPAPRILLFAKAPVAGRVKTRLIPALGAPAAAELYAVLLKKMVATALTVAPVELWCWPDTRHSLFRQLTGAARLSLRAQQGEGLGERMCFAAQQALQTTDRALLIGADCPVLTAAYLEQALCSLSEGCDAVIGPAEDGGYVLLGLRRVDDALFREIAWGTGSVFKTTRERLVTLGWRWRELEVLWDIDRPGDLQRYAALPGSG